MVKLLALTLSQSVGGVRFLAKATTSTHPFFPKAGVPDLVFLELNMSIIKSH